MRIGRGFEPRFIFGCQLVEVIRDADANEPSGEMDWRCLIALLVNPN